MNIFDEERTDEEIIKTLYKAWELDLTDKQACIYANIGMDRLKALYDRYPDLINEKQLLKETPMTKVKKILNKSLDEGNIDTAKWYAKNKASNEFSEKNIVEQDNSLIDDKLNALQQFMEKFDDTTTETR